MSSQKVTLGVDARETCSYNVLVSHKGDGKGYQRTCISPDSVKLQDTRIIVLAHRYP